MTNIFGTDGIRNKVGRAPFTIEILPKLGYAIGQWINEKYGDWASVLIAHDTRQSYSWVKSTLKSGLLRHPLVTYDTGILPTAALFYLLKPNSKYNCGLVISASHNPYCDNGIKIIDGQNGKISSQDEEYISKLMLSEKGTYQYTNLGHNKALFEAEEFYISSITNLFTPNFLKEQTIVLDMAHGAAYKVAQTIFTQLGALVIPINNSPNGLNINDNCGALHLEQLQEAVIKYKAIAGFAFDGDADRVIAVNNQGQIKNGDDILALLSTHPEYANISTIIGTVMSNQALEMHFKNNNKTLIRTHVGDKYITQYLKEHKLPLGGEPSGHIILQDIINTADGILVALKVMETLLYTNNRSMETFQKFPQVCINLPVTEKKDLQQSPFKEIIADANSLLTQGRLLVRYSGTEHSLRIMVEDQDQHYATTIAHKLAQNLNSHLTSR